MYCTVLYCTRGKKGILFCENRSGPGGESIKLNFKCLSKFFLRRKGKFLEILMQKMLWHCLLCTNFLLLYFLLPTLYTVINFTSFFGFFTLLF